jgi:hypothetical protein
MPPIVTESTWRQRWPSFGCRVLVQLGSSAAHSDEVGQRGARGAGDVVGRLRAERQEVALDARHQAGDGRHDVVLREVIEGAVVVHRLDELLRVEAHVHAVQRGDGDGLRRFGLVLHRHHVADPADVLVRGLHAKGRAVGTRTSGRHEALVVLTIDRTDELQLLVRDAQRFLRHKVSDLENVVGSHEGFL